MGLKRALFFFPFRVTPCPQLLASASRPSHIARHVRQRRPHCTPPSPRRVAYRTASWLPSKRKNGVSYPRYAGLFSHEVGRQRGYGGRYISSALRKGISITSVSVSLTLICLICVKQAFLCGVLTISVFSPFSHSYSSLNLSSDVLEEFLSILKPSFLMSPSSPTFRPRRQGSASAFAVPLERPFAFKPRDKTYNNENPSITTLPREDYDAVANSAYSEITSQQEGSSRIPGVLGMLWYISYIAWLIPPFRPAESPVSRMHTRNPFQRHPTYDLVTQNALTNNVSPTLLPLPPSPSPVPLRLDSPESLQASSD